MTFSKLLEDFDLDNREIFIESNLNLKNESHIQKYSVVNPYVENVLLKYHYTLTDLYWPEADPDTRNMYFKTKIIDGKEAIPQPTDHEWNLGRNLEFYYTVEGGESKPLKWSSFTHTPLISWSGSGRFVFNFEPS
jgi:hypothetical protein